MRLTTKPFGTLDGKAVTLFHMEASDGAYAEVISYGGIIHSIVVPDQDGKLDDVILGQNTLEDYRTRGLGAALIIGRFANRIVGAKFSLNGRVYQLEQGRDGNAMHGGSGNYSRFVFDYVGSSQTEDAASVTLRHFDDGRGGYPGCLTLTLTYTFTEDHKFQLDYRILPTEDTPVSITNHCYFNLAGHHSGVIDDQQIQIEADFFTPNDKTCAPTARSAPSRERLLTLLRKNQSATVLPPTIPKSWRSADSTTISVSEVEATAKPLPLMIRIQEEL